MQFPVPQFTDVEDKIIAGLTIKQFGILFGVGVIIFLAFSASKSLIVAGFFFLLFGLPGLALTFGKINGRPMYANFGIFIKFFTAPRVLIFHKEITGLPDSAQLKTMDVSKVEETKSQEVSDPRSRLLQVNALLKKQAEEELELTRKIR